MKEIKLILLDLDGTLLIKEGQVPKELTEVIRKLKEKGIMLGIATGRYYGSVINLFKDTYKDMVVVSCNGGSVYVNNQNVLFTPFDEELYKEVLKASRKVDESYIVIQPMQDLYVLAIKDDPLNKLMEEYGMPVKEVLDFDSHTKDISAMCLMTRDLKDYDYTPYFKELEDKVELTPSGYGCVDIMPKGISKATGIKRLCDILNISIENVMAMGDAMNDYEMLKTVGLPVAMANADEKIKNICKLVTPKPNTENGCLDFIKEYFELD